jgi:hypothetical protein
MHLTAFSGHWTHWCWFCNSSNVCTFMAVIIYTPLFADFSSIHGFITTLQCCDVRMFFWVHATVLSVVIDLVIHAFMAIRWWQSLYFAPKKHGNLCCPLGDSWYPHIFVFRLQAQIKSSSIRGACEAGFQESRLHEVRLEVNRSSTEIGWLIHHSDWSAGDYLPTGYLT